MKSVSKCLVLFVVVVMIGTIMVACNGEKVQITFDYNVGNLIYSMQVQQVEVQKGNTISQYPGFGIDCGQIEGYYIEGWYTAKTDNKGNVLVDSNRFVRLDKKWDFENNRATENITLYAHWVKKPPIKPNTYKVYFDYNLGNLMSGTGQWIAGRELNIVKNTAIFDDENVIPDNFPSNCWEYYECNGRKYQIEGWYIAQIDSFGNILKDENGFVLLDEKWDLQNDLVQSDMASKTTCLYAKLIIST